MSDTLHLEDERSTADLRTFVARARAVDERGAVRLQATGATLAVWVGVLAGRGLTGAGTVLGMRALRLARPLETDVVVPLAAVADRLARPGAGTALTVPPVEVPAAWASVSPPRSGWEPVGRVEEGELRAAAARCREQAAADGRTAWEAPLGLHDPAATTTAGAALAAELLGFLGAGSATVLACGRWRRLSTDAGHVLTR